MKPYEKLPDHVEYKDTGYRIDYSYSCFFAVADLFNDQDLTDYEKLETALDILVDDPHPVDDGLLIAVYESIKEQKPAYNGPKLMDIFQDWPYICAGFLQTYGIDLYTDKRMHIIKFRQLLNGLPKDTKLAEIMAIRGADIPEPTKYNQERIAELTRLKTAYSLHTENIQDGFAKLFNILEARANG